MLRTHYLQTNHSFIGGGNANLVNNNAVASFIGGGDTNAVSSNHSGIGAGTGNNINTNGRCSFIGGGQANQILQQGNHSFIGGGNGNTINADCGAILGGSGNTVNHAWAGVFGQNVTTAMQNAFHTNELVLQNIQAGNPVTCAPPAGAVPGKLYFVVVAPGGFRQLWIA